jgi:hypothetical protein
MVSLAIIVYLFARAIPRVTEKTAVEPEKNYFEKLIRKIPLEKADAFVNAILGKLLRRMKIVTLKLENFLAKHLRDLKQGNNKDDKVGQPNIFEKKDDNGVK